MPLRCEASYWSLADQGIEASYGGKVITSVITDPTKNKKGKFRRSVPQPYTVKHLRNRIIVIRQVVWEKFQICRYLEPEVSLSDCSDSDSDSDNSSEYLSALSSDPESF